MREAVIVSTARTPIGKAYRGAFNNTYGATLAGHSIAAVVERAGVDPAEIDDVVFGCALEQGTTGNNIARQAALRAGLPVTVSGMTLDRQCSSGLMAIATAAKYIINDGAPIAIGGGVALIGNTPTIARLAADLPVETSGIDLGLKMLLALGFLANALLKFVWAHRLFGYCSILMAAVPNDPSDPAALPRALQAAEINITAAKSFNRGLRSIYFALAALAWILGPWTLVAATLAAATVLLRREFWSQSRQVMLTPPR